MLAFIFPGQGSQKRGMGEGLFDRVTEFRAIESQIDACLGYSIRALCLEDAGNRLSQTQYTQPAMYIVNALHYYAAVAAGDRPHVVAGHSVGEYNALLAAGAFDLLTGLRLVNKRAELMGRAKDGGMAAVVGLTAARVEQVLRDFGLTSIDLANYNSPTQTVISGPVGDLNRAQRIFEQAGAQLYVPLRVSAAFHSRYMAPAAVEFAGYIASVPIRRLTLTVISNVTGRPYPADASSEQIKTSLVKQITSSVMWSQSVECLLARGVTEFKELGPNTVLTKLVQQTQQQQATV